MSSHVQNITVPWVPVADFDWSFARSGPLPWNQTVWSILAVFTALPLWTTVELTAWIFYSFQRYNGLYFWSVLACTWGVTIHAIGFVLKFCVPQCNWILATVLAEIGWVGMVTGFSVVLYSRLKLLVTSQTVRRWTLVMIITDALLFHVPTIVFQFCVSNKATHKKFLPYMAPMERVQVMAFSIQETIISAIYIYFTLQYLRESFHRSTRKTTTLLIAVQIIVIFADVIVITLDYCEYFTLKAVLHSFVYAFKLQLEFVILNDVKAMANKGALSALTPGEVHFGPRDIVTMDQQLPSVAGLGKKWWSSKTGPSDSTVDPVQSTSEIFAPALYQKRAVSTSTRPVINMEHVSRSSSDSATRSTITGSTHATSGGLGEKHSVTNSHGEDDRVDIDNDVERLYGRDF